MLSTHWLVFTSHTMPHVDWSVSSYNSSDWLLQEIYKDRKKFSASVFDVASSDLVNMGLIVVSYTLKDIRDDEGYLKALGMARTAQVDSKLYISKISGYLDSGSSCITQ